MSSATITPTRLFGRQPCACRPRTGKLSRNREKTYARNDVVQHRTLFRPESVLGTEAERADGSGTRPFELGDGVSNRVSGGGHRRRTPKTTLHGHRTSRSVLRCTMIDSVPDESRTNTHSSQHKTHVVSRGRTDFERRGTRAEPDDRVLRAPPAQRTARPPKSRRRLLPKPARASHLLRGPTGRSAGGWWWKVWWRARCDGRWPMHARHTDGTRRFKGGTRWEFPPNVLHESPVSRPLPVRRATGSYTFLCSPLHFYA